MTQRQRQAISNANRDAKAPNMFPAAAWMILVFLIPTAVFLALALSNQS